eukprot:SAG22_NODE_321_length_12398_cov_3.218392_15_plen_136_part_00
MIAALAAQQALFAAQAPLLTAIFTAHIRENSGEDAVLNMKTYLSAAAERGMATAAGIDGVNPAGRPTEMQRLLMFQAIETKLAALTYPIDGASILLPVYLGYSCSSIYAWPYIDLLLKIKIKFLKSIRNMIPNVV